MIRDLQKAAVMANPAMAAANIAAAQSDAMRTAAANPSGAAMGFMGMGMAGGVGGMNASQLFNQAAQQAPAQAAPAAAIATRAMTVQTETEDSCRGWNSAGSRTGMAVLSPRGPLAPCKGHLRFNIDSY